MNIYDDQNNLIYEQTLALDEYGAFDDELMLAEDAVLGSFYRIEVLNPLEDRRALIRNAVLLGGGVPHAGVPGERHCANR